MVQVDVREASPQLGPVEVQSAHVLVLPIAGVFAKHDASRSCILGTPNDAVFICADQPYHLSYPAGIGDRCLTVRFSTEALSELLATSPFQMARLTAPVLLSAPVIVVRNLLWHRFQTGQWDAIEVDELGGLLVEEALRLPREDERSQGRPLLRHRAAIEAVKEAVASDPPYRWSLSKLGRVANVSPFHLSRLFRSVVGTSVYDYVLRARLATALDLMVDTKMELTAVSLDSGFSSQSHFSARFRAFFGFTPTAFR
ncbi:hypothetical protein C2W62_47875, partial [Candidatus Entotheonella serta]